MPTLILETSFPFQVAYSSLIINQGTKMSSCDIVGNFNFNDTICACIEKRSIHGNSAVIHKLQSCIKSFYCKYVSSRKLRRHFSCLCGTAEEFLSILSHGFEPCQSIENYSVFCDLMN